MAQLLAPKTPSSLSSPWVQRWGTSLPLCSCAPPLFSVSLPLNLHLQRTTSELTEGAAAAFTDQHNQSRHCKWLANLCIRCIFCTAAMQLYWLGCNLRLSGFLCREPDESRSYCGHLRSFIACLCRKVAQVSITIYSLHWQWFLLDPSPIMIVVTD